MWTDQFQAPQPPNLEKDIGSVYLSQNTINQTPAYLSSLIFPPPHIFILFFYHSKKITHFLNDHS